MSIIRNGILTSGSAVITGFEKTYDLRVGWYLYASKLPVEIKILSIDSNTQITVDKNALDSGTVSIDFSYVQVGVLHERNNALIDVKNTVDERGDELTFIYRDESKVTRGDYGGIIRLDNSIKYYFKSYPVTYNPNVDMLREAGLREESEVLVYFATKDFRDNNINFEDIDINRGSIILQGENFEIKEKGRISQFADIWLYYTFGLSKR